MINTKCTVDACKVFKPAGGGIVATAWPIQAFDLNELQTMIGATLCTSANSEACRFPFGSGMLYPIQIQGLGASTDYRFGIDVTGIDQNVCIQINNLVGVTNPGNSPPVYGTDITAVPHTLNSSSGFDLTHFANAYQVSGTLISGKRDFCFFNGGGVYLYTHEFYD